MSWLFSLGNLISRAGAAPVATVGTIDPNYPIEMLGNGYPDEATRWAYSAGGVYTTTFDLSLVRLTTDRADAPLGWADLTNLVSGTPGLPANPPQRGTFGTRTLVVKAFRPSFQDMDVMPGESVTLDFAIRLPAGDGSTATNVGVRLQDLKSGKWFNESTNLWQAAPAVVAETAADAWTDVTEVVAADPDRTERTTYRLILFLEAPVFDATAYGYFHDPAMFAAQNFFAIIGHNLPAGATVTWSDGTVTYTMTLAYPSFYFQDTVETTSRVWTLTVTIPTAARPYADRPLIGELWAGRLVLDQMPCPVFPFDLEVEDFGQVRLAGGRGRLAVFSDSNRAHRKARLRFKNNFAGYVQSRDGIMAATRNGADPMVLVPQAVLEGATALFHGRVGFKTVYTQTSNNVRAWDIELDESPFPGGTP